jgi:hydrogenase expression/formation protein HypC
MCLAVPGRVLEIKDQQGTRVAVVDLGGVVRDVNLAMVPDVAAGDYLVAHSGFAVRRMSEAEALETARLLDEMGEAAQ